MSYLRYLCLLTYSGVQHILCYAFVLFFFVLCTLCCQFLWIVHLFLIVFSVFSSVYLLSKYHDSFNKYCRTFLIIYYELVTK